MIVSNEIRILIAGSQTLFRQALRNLLQAEGGFWVVGEAYDGDSAVALASRIRPDIALLDIEMPEDPMITTVRQLQSASPRSRVVVLSVHDAPELISSMLRTGVHGYLHKGIGKEDLFEAIRNVWADDQRVTVSVSRDSMMRAGSSDRTLSDRERQVLSFVAQAMSNRQIARRLAITEGTVKRHLSNIFDKLDAVSRIDAVNKAAEIALIPGPADRASATGGPAARLTEGTDRHVADVPVQLDGSHEAHARGGIGSLPDDHQHRKVG
jgi:DNA-binding NarL/FixJ family response regulator